jgi:hypothetical protein
VRRAGHRTRDSLPVHVESGPCPCGRIHGTDHLATCAHHPVACEAPWARPAPCNVSTRAVLDRCDASVWVRR